MKSAIDHPDVVSLYLAEEVSAGRVLGPFPADRAYALAWHISRFGVIPKHHRPDQWRLIVDMSFPPEASINDGIDPTLCSLKYTKVGEVAEAIAQLGVGSELAKADIKVYQCILITVRC